MVPSHPGHSGKGTAGRELGERRDLRSSGPPARARRPRGGGRTGLPGGSEVDGTLRRPARLHGGRGVPAVLLVGGGPIVRRRARGLRPEPERGGGLGEGRVARRYAHPHRVRPRWGPVLATPVSG